MAPRRRGRIAPVNIDAPNRIQVQKPARSFGSFKKWFILLFVFLGLASVYTIYSLRQASMRNRATTPHPDQILPKDWTTLGKNADKFWGSYRPGVYFGMKARSTQSPVFGLMWFVQFDRTRTDFRHNCDQDLKLPKYGWVAHDGVNFGYEEIHEKDFILNVSFVKDSEVGIHGGDWTAKFDVTVLKGDSGNSGSSEQQSEVYVSLISYIALDGQGELESVVDRKTNHLNKIRGYTNELGYFDVVFSNYDQSLEYNYLETYLPSLHLLKEAIKHYSSAISIKDKSHSKKGQRFVLLPGSKIGQLRESSSNPDIPMNLVAIQVTSKSGSSFSMETRFESASYTNRNEPLSGHLYDTKLKMFKDDFDVKFENVFGLRSKGFDADQVNFAKSVFSNLIGGIGYFFGASAIQTEQFDSPMAYWYTTLYSAVPSRSFFPRGFLWDEGFHQIVISKWNCSLTEDVMGHWMDLMNIDGWIPREQILGSEALARVPREFIVQHTSNANPPSFLLSLDSLLNKKELSVSFLKKLYPKVKQWILWYNNTQFGPLRSTYQWRGRNGSNVFEVNAKTLTSGLDDYPRASHPNHQEYHLDLRCWITLASQVLNKLAKAIDHPDNFEAWEREMSDFDLLNKLHWSKKLNYYTDVGINSEDIILVKPQKRHPEEEDRQMTRKVMSPVSDEPVNVPHLGYVSLFPFLMKLLPHDSIQLQLTLEHIRNPSTLWTNYGIRSLSKQDPLYMKRNTEHDPPYWRGQIWINMNYMILRSLHHYGGTSKTSPNAVRAREIYSELRTNLINNLHRQYKQSGYVWENYNDSTGQGQGAHPFTGWTSLIILIMAEDYS